MRCISPYTSLLCFLRDGERRFFEKKFLIWNYLFPCRELFVLVFFNCLKVVKQRLMSSTIVQAVQTEASHNFTGRVTDPQYIQGYKLNVETIECNFGWQKLHKWPDRNLFGFAFKTGVMDKIKVPRHRYIQQYLRRYPWKVNFVIQNWNKIIETRSCTFGAILWLTFTYTIF